jgi:iron complex transport system ATP-binding protein
VSTLVATDLHVRLGSREVLRSASLTLPRGRLVLLAGRNGAGKSTLLRAMIGAQATDRGMVLLENKAIVAWLDRERAQRIAFVPQHVDVPFEFTGRQLIAMGRYPHSGRHEDPTDDDVEAIARAIAAVDAAEFVERAVPTLSGGEMRRIAVARALATETPFLLLDEPTANLDLEHALQLVALLRRIATAGAGVLVASHDLNLLAPHCDHVALLHEGRIWSEGPPQQVLWPGNVQAVFGVRSAAASGFFPREFRL